MTISREILSIMAGIEAMAEPRASSARALPGKSSTARVEAMLRVIGGTILPRRLVVRAETGETITLQARSGRLIAIEGAVSADLEIVAAALVAHAGHDGPHRYEVHLIEDSETDVGYAAADLRAACTTALQTAEGGDDSGFATLSLASAGLAASGALIDPKGEAGRLPQDPDAALAADVADIQRAMGHLGGGDGFQAIGLAEDGTSRLIIADMAGQTSVAVSRPGTLTALMRVWSDTCRSDKG